MKTTKDYMKDVETAVSFDDYAESRRALLNHEEELENENDLDESIEDELDECLDELIDEPLENGPYMVRATNYKVVVREDGEKAVMIWLDVEGHSRELFKYQMLNSFNAFIGRAVRIWAKGKGVRINTKKDALDFMLQESVPIKFENTDGDWDYQITFLAK